MADVFIGEILCVPYNFAPKGFAFCNGQLMSISQNTALFSLLGTQFGGDGRSTFALPNMMGRVVIGQGQGVDLSNYSVGVAGGGEFQTISQNQMPVHNHSVLTRAGLGTTNTPTAGTFAVASVNGTIQNLYSTASNVTLAADTLLVNGDTLSHENRQPFLVMAYVIALQGIFPSRP